MDLATTALRLETLGNETRLAVFRILVRAGGDGLTVGEVHERTGVARSTLSHHLSKLISVGLVRQQRAGTTLHCIAIPEAMDETLGFLLRECCADVAGHAAGSADDADRTCTARKQNGPANDVA